MPTSRAKTGHDSPLLLAYVGWGVRVIAASVLLLSATTALALETLEPRPFGYTVGDVLERRVRVDRAEDGTIDPASLPRPGRVGRWFQLREVSSDPRGVRLLYQLVNAPPEPARENLPSLELRVIGPDGRARQVPVGPFTVAMAPLMPPASGDEVQDSDVRPDLDPPPIDTSAPRRRVLAYASALAALAAVQLGSWLARRIGWRSAGPFAGALRALRREARHRTTAETARAGREALRLLHQALDESAGHTLALDNLETLFGIRPWLAPARGRIQALLAASRETFFGAAPPPPIGEIMSLAVQLAELERRR